jgi:uncharacterized protein YacL
LVVAPVLALPVLVLTLPVLAVVVVALIAAVVLALVAPVLARLAVPVALVPAKAVLAVPVLTVLIAVRVLVVAVLVASVIAAAVPALVPHIPGALGLVAVLVPVLIGAPALAASHCAVVQVLRHRRQCQQDAQATQCSVFQKSVHVITPFGGCTRRGAARRWKRLVTDSSSASA